MILQRFFVVRLVDIFEDFGDDGRIAIGVEINFLVIGNFTNLAITWSARSAMLRVVLSWAGIIANLVSAKLDGRSTVIAPPKNSVFVNAIFDNCCG